MHLFNRILFCMLITPGCAGHPSETVLAATQSEYGALPERFTGYYEVGWEEEVFRPCGLQEEWWTWSGGRIIQDDPRGWGRVFVVLEGRVSARGSYGHRGRYPRQIVITTLIEIRPADSTACPSSPRMTHAGPTLSSPSRLRSGGRE